MFCSKCGSGVPEEADFCHKCGTKVLKEADIKAVQETEKKVETITVTAEAISQVSPKSDKRILEVVLGIIGGIFGIFAGFFALFFGGLSSAFGDETSGNMIGSLGIAAILFSVIGIISAIIAGKRGKLGGLFMLVAAIGGTVSISLFYILPGILLFIPAIMSLVKKNQNSKGEKWFIWIPIAIVLLAVVFVFSFMKPEGSGGNNSAEDEEETYEIGDEVSVKGLTFTVHEISLAKDISDGFFSNTAKGVYLILDVTVQNDDDESRTVDSSLFTLVEEDGTEYSPDSSAGTTVNDDLEFFLTELNPKLSVRGKIVFDIPDPELECKLRVSGGMLSTKYKEIELDMEEAKGQEVGTKEIQPQETESSNTEVVPSGDIVLVMGTLNSLQYNETPIDSISNVLPIEYEELAGDWFNEELSYIVRFDGYTYNDGYMESEWMNNFDITGIGKHNNILVFEAGTEYVGKVIKTGNNSIAIEINGYSIVEYSRESGNVTSTEPSVATEFNLEQAEEIALEIFQTYLTVSVTEGRFRALPSTDAEIYGKLTKGAEFFIYDTFVDETGRVWCYIEAIDEEGSTVWGWTAYTNFNKTGQ